MKTFITLIIVVVLIVIGVMAYNSYQASYVAPNPEIINNNVTSTTTVQTSSNTVNTSASEAYPVSIVNFSFSPVTLTISKGDSVVWTNMDSSSHQVSAAGFEGPVLSQGQTYTHVFNTVGTFNYICKIHPTMKGMVIVQ